MWFVKVFRGGGDMEKVRRAVAVEIESPPPELYAVEEPYRKIVEEVAVYVAERGRLEKEKYNELYRRFRELYPLPSQLIQQAMNQGVETGKSFLELKRDGRVRKPRPEVGRVSIRFAKDSWSYKKAISSTAPVRLALSLPGGRREVWIKPHRKFWLYWWKVLSKEAELASTLIVKRRRNKWYAVFVFDLAPEREPPEEAVAFNVNENSVAAVALTASAAVLLVVLAFMVSDSVGLRLPALTYVVTVSLSKSLFALGFFHMAQPLYGTLLILTAAHSVVIAPLAYSLVKPSWEKIRIDTRKACVLYLGPLKCVTQIISEALGPTLVQTWLVALASSLSETTLALMLTTGGAATLSAEAVRLLTSRAPDLIEMGHFYSAVLALLVLVLLAASRLIKPRPYSI
jgi:ABC-type spermidine/putrescine transport system permease subunit II